MDEEELEEYLRQIELMREYADYRDSPLLEKLVDDEGYEVPGCFRVVPAPVE
jgi:hypothetical protein